LNATIRQLQSSFSGSKVLHGSKVKPSFPIWTENGLAARLVGACKKADTVARTAWHNRALTMKGLEELKLTCRTARPDGTVVEVGGVHIGGRDVVDMAGP
jgi:hypothetical protein